MSIRNTSFRWCMVIGAVALLGVAGFYAFTYIGVSSVVRTANFTPFYAQTIRGLWIGYCLQAALLGLLFSVAAFRPHWISQPLLIICGLLPLAQAVLASSFTGSLAPMVLLFLASLFILLGAVLWPKAPVTPAPATAPVTSATAPLP